MNYRQADSPAENCGKCQHGGFSGSSSAGLCEIVAGKIDVKFVCDRFEPEQEPDGDDTPEGEKAENPFAKKEPVDA